jgi:CubicO group peptidase (beta-lactamase class C family)
VSPRHLLRLALNALTCCAVVLGGAAPAAAQNAAPIPYTTLSPRPRPVVRRVAPPVAPPQAINSTPGVLPLEPPLLEAYVDGVVAAAMADQHLAGVAVAVVQNGQVVLKKGYGVDRQSPRRAVDPDRTLFRIGSISKTFTWIALQKEVEAGRMRLDAPVNLYLPERLQLKDQGLRQQVRLRDLITHTSGFEERTFGQSFERDWQRVRSLNQYLRQERPRRVREPGELVSYSNYDAALAGAAVANVQGKTFERMIEERVLVPAGLANTTFREPRPERPDLPQPMTATMADRLSQGYEWRNGGFMARPFEYIGQAAPAGAASSTAGDMARYMTLLLNGGSIDGGSVYSPRVDAALRGNLWRAAPGAAGWTGGLQDIPMPGGRRGLGHIGQTLSFQSNMVLVPQLNLGVFVVANSPGGRVLADTLPDSIVRRFFGPPAAPPAAVATPADPQAFVGTYLTVRRAYAGLEAFVDRLAGRARVTAAADGRLITKIDDAERAWLPTAEPGVYRAADGAPEPLVFRAGANGKAQLLFAPWGGATYERQAFLDSVLLMALLAAATGLAALATVAGLFLRDAREFRQTQVQSRTALLQVLQAGLWLIALTCFAVWAVRAKDVLRLVYEWPGGLLVTASACALVAGILGAVNLVLLPIIWKGGRRVDSWTPGRKLRFTATALIFVAFTALIGIWGGLTAWVA